MRLNHGSGGKNEQSINPLNLQPRFYSSSAVRPFAPFDIAPPPQLGGAEASVPRPARGTGPNARLRARTRFPPIYLGPNLHAIIASLAGRGVGGFSWGRRFRRGCAVHLPVLLGVVVSFPLSCRTLLPGHHRLGPGGSVRSGPTTGLMVSLTGPEAAPVRSSNHSPVAGRVHQPCGWIVYNNLTPPPPPVCGDTGSKGRPTDEDLHSSLKIVARSSDSLRACPSWP